MTESKDSADANSSEDKATEVETKVDESVQEGGADDSAGEPSQPDYEALLEQERTRREKAENSIEKYKREAKKAKESTSEEKSDDAGATGLSLDDIRQAIREENQTFQKEMMGDKVTNAAKAIAKNESEAAFIEYQYHNGIQPSGNLERDMKRAKLLANEEVLLAREAELSKTAEAKKNRGKGSASSQDTNSSQTDEPDVSAKDKAFLGQWKSDKGYWHNEGDRFALRPDGTGGFEQIEVK